MKTKKLLAILLAAMMVVSLGTMAFAAEPIEESNSKRDITDYSVDEVKALDQYITVENGYFNFDSVVALEDGVDYTLVDAVRSRISSLNEHKLNAEISINNDGTISSQTQNFTIQRAAAHWVSCGGGQSWPAIEYWWGYSRKMCDCESRAFANDLLTAAIGGGVLMLGAVWFPPALFAGGLSGAYLTLLSTRVTANNYGYGVITDVTWALVFDITPQ